MAIGVPVGIAAAHRPRFYRILRPVLALMEQLPLIVYLVPALALFGLGLAPGLIATIVFTLPVPIRMTHSGLTTVPKPLTEAGEAFGASKRQVLWKIELPAARPAIIAGLGQCLMLALSMVVISALIGAGGLGQPVLRSLNSLNVPLGLEAVLAIVVLAAVIERMSRAGLRKKA